MAYLYPEKRLALTAEIPGTADVPTDTATTTGAPQQQQPTAQELEGFEDLPKRQQLIKKQKSAI